MVPGNTYYVQLDGYSSTGTATIVITEVALTVPTFSAVAPVCNGTVAALPTTSTNNITGTWSPAINPNATTVYTFTPDAGQCAASTTLTITVPSTTWNGAAWSNSAPTSTTLAIFEGAFSSTGDLSACRVLVNSGAVTINSGNDFTVANAVTVSGGSLTFENNANLLQTTNAANSGAITVKRNATMRRLDYVYWGSPVAAQNLKAFSPQTVSPPVGASRFYTMDETTNSFSAITTPENATFTLAKGYMLRAPNNFPTNGSQATFNGEFNGVPNNGDAAIAITNTPGTGQGFNMLGNPYPSTVSADLFLAQNPGSLYFWAHANQNAASGANYATYTTFGTAAAAGGATSDGSIAVGQGFLLKTAASGTATFTNAMRTGNNTALFFRNATVDKSRIWLNLSDANGTQNQILVGYMDGATNDADVSVDAKQIEGNISNIASLIGGEKYNIQARALPFADTDEIPLSFNALTAGTFSIGIDHVDGLFTGDQNVYVKDNVSGIIHNIKESAYTFAAEAGTTTNRFSVVFQSTTLGIENPAFDANSVVVYKNNDVLHINSGSMTMSGVKVFDIRGRLIFEQSGINANTAALTNLRAAQEVLLVQITSADNKVVTKKVVY
ncbi:T9SS sorting signal type C domain-containing protein [Flavobacterium sp. 3HN19-14]|uniref:T9SS sorting signal type C domain-containing protein n=1 Tax=Flavobacterium sp. 3HN19-14 TaxID=3448133 RepID=UPI003EE0D486